VKNKNRPVRWAALGEEEEEEEEAISWENDHFQDTKSHASTSRANTSPTTHGGWSA